MYHEKTEGTDPYPGDVQMHFFLMFFYDHHPAAIKQLLRVIVKRDGNTGTVLYIMSVHWRYFCIFFFFS